jgi:predicted unusual protein kinase regulating ubiquinone biosynthesis (AarF/ABC1/UbiB family)
MVKPIALAMFKLSPTEYDEFIQEVESRMLEETDYDLELERSMDLSQRTRHLKNILFPTYYPKYSSSRILTMDWIEGRPLGEVLKSPIPQADANRLGQAMWDFYHFQMHTLKAVHADPHPGNFIITPDNQLGIIDFGCVKEIPADFYDSYFQLMDRRILTDTVHQQELFQRLRFIYPDDSPKQKAFFTATFIKLIEMLSRPFRDGEFDFANKAYFEELYEFGEKLSTMKELRDSKKARGIRDAVYLNRTYFGMYTILHDLKAKIVTKPD